MYYKRPHISGYLRNDTALSEKLPILADPPVSSLPTQQTPAKIRTTLLSSETTVHWPHFCIADN